MKKLFILLISLFWSVQAQAAIVTKTIEYKDRDTVLEGVLVFDDAIKGPRPGVLIVHDWKGVGDYVKMRAEQVARLGYAAFAADIYGKGVRPATTEEAAAQATQYKSDRQLLRERVSAGLDRLKEVPLVDPSRLAAMGYCFGGTTVLELARSGADVKGVVSFHGGLDTPTPQDARNIKGKVLALHGADDPYVPPAEVAGFEDEMRQAGVDWQLVSYGGAVHSFTHREAGDDPSKGAAYNEKADRRSWEALVSFLNEIFVP